MIGKFLKSIMIMIITNQLVFATVAQNENYAKWANDISSGKVQITSFIKENFKKVPISSQDYLIFWQRFEKAKMPKVEWEKDHFNVINGKEKVQVKMGAVNKNTIVYNVDGVDYNYDLNLNMYTNYENFVNEFNKKRTKTSFINYILPNAHAGVLVATGLTLAVFLGVTLYINHLINSWNDEERAQREVGIIEATKDVSHFNCRKKHVENLQEKRLNEISSQEKNTANILKMGVDRVLSICANLKEIYPNAEADTLKRAEKACYFYKQGTVSCIENYEEAVNGTRTPKEVVQPATNPAPNSATSGSVQQ